ncbi:hypothetical protein HID58_040572 [Brassica napus]|uniref:Uncharacterized protein n=1 Tax=Brassica napus TaxID=3708 RepID=A0ABQ8B8F5_BRANA|nr:hypothetical protein HID58_040572 [Brassica napus]
MDGKDDVVAKEESFKGQSERRLELVIHEGQTKRLCASHWYWSLAPAYICIHQRKEMQTDSAIVGHLPFAGDNHTVVRHGKYLQQVSLLLFNECKKLRL